MAITSGGWPTLADVASRLDPDGTASHIANVLSKENPILDYIPWYEGNLPTGHLITQAANALPSATWRRINTGAARTRAQTVQYTESCGVLEDWSEIDERLYELNGGDAYRMSEDTLKQEGIAQQFATAFFYESITSNPERVHGLSARYPATTGYTSSGQVLAGTNAGSNAHSVWMICFGPNKLYGIYPKGTKAGLEMIDLGKQRVLDTNSNPYIALSTQHVWRCGIAVEDYRFAVRAQWDPDDLDMADDEKGLILLMGKMHSTIYRAKGAIIVMNRTSVAKLNAQLISNDSGPLRYLAGDGGQLMAGIDTGIATWNGFRILVNDSLVAETAIS